jgi:F0F1-type ATP synthase alpha subunit
MKAMKQVSGTLKLDLAQYREVAAFAAFGSDLDAATQQQLNRGARLVEMLKQDQFVPISVEEQVVILFAGVRGHLDTVPVEEVPAFEVAWRKFINDNHSDILKTINVEGEISDALESKISEICKNFVENFSA